MPLDLAEFLRSWLPTLDRDAPLFPGLKDKRTSKMMRRDLAAAGLPYVTARGEYRPFHSLRHTHISALWATGADPVTVRQLARHSDPNLTMQYSHRDRRNETAAIRKLPKLFEGAEGRSSKRSSKGA